MLALDVLFAELANININVIPANIAYLALCCTNVIVFQDLSFLKVCLEEQLLSYIQSQLVQCTYFFSSNLYLRSNRWLHGAQEATSALDSPDNYPNQNSK